MAAQRIGTHGPELDERDPAVCEPSPVHEWGTHYVLNGDRRLRAASCARTGPAFPVLTHISALGETHCPKAFMEADKPSANVLQGTLDLLILRTVASGEKHGYEIAEWIHAASAAALSVEEGALYPALHRLELRGLLASAWDMSANNRRAKYYRLTASGRRRLRESTESWRRASAAINRVLDAT